MSTPFCERIHKENFLSQIRDWLEKGEFKSVVTGSAKLSSKKNHSNIVLSLKAWNFYFQSLHYTFFSFLKNISPSICRLLLKKNLVKNGFFERWCVKAARKIFPPFYIVTDFFINTLKFLKLIHKMKYKCIVENYRIFLQDLDILNCFILFFNFI